jgi:hypothetical protein
MSAEKTTKGLEPQGNKHGEGHPDIIDTGIAESKDGGTTKITAGETIPKTPNNLTPNNTNETSAKETPKTSLKKTLKMTLTKALKETPKETPKETLKEILEETLKVTFEEPLKETVKKMLEILEEIPQKTSTQKTSIEGVPAEQTPTEQTPAEQTSTNQTPAQSARSRVAFNQNLPMDHPHYGHCFVDKHGKFLYRCPKLRANGTQCRSEVKGTPHGVNSHNCQFHKTDSAAILGTLSAINLTCNHRECMAAKSSEPASFKNFDSYLTHHRTQHMFQKDSKALKDDYFLRVFHALKEQEPPVAHEEVEGRLKKKFAEHEYRIFANRMRQCARSTKDKKSPWYNWKEDQTNDDEADESEITKAAPTEPESEPEAEAGSKKRELDEEDQPIVVDRAPKRFKKGNAKDDAGSGGSALSTCG